MSLVNPMALTLAGLAVPIVVCYILKIRLRRVPVSTLLFWQQIFEETKPRSLWQHLRHLLSLLLQLAFLSLLVFALADPIFRWQQARARRLVLVVDNSASMNAHDILPSRLAAAKAEGRRLIDGLRLGDELAIIAAEAIPRVVCGSTDHQRTLRAALESIAATEGPTRVVESVALARRLLSGSEKLRKVVVLSDGSFDGAALLLKQSDVELVTLGKPTANVGITRLAARRSLLDPIGYEILVEVANASDEPASFRLELDLAGDPIDVVPLTLAAGERTVSMFDKTSAEGGRLRAHIDRPDALEADNTAWAILPRRSRQKVTLVTPGNLFLEKVFEAMPLVDLTILKTDKNASNPPPAPSSGDESAITVYHKKVPISVAAETGKKGAGPFSGPVFVIDPERSGSLWEVGEPLHNPVVARQDKDSPLLLHVRLDHVVMPEARKLVLKGPAHVLAESVAGDPLYAVLDRADGADRARVVVLTVDLDQSDLPLQTAFPIMATNLLNWFGGTKGELREAVAAGGTATVEVTPERTAGPEFILGSPDGRELPLAAPAGTGTSRLTVGPLDRTGIWSIRRRAARTTRTNVDSRSQAVSDVVAELACNLADRRETDLRPAQGLAEHTTGLAAGLAVRPVWYYLLAAAFLLTCWEWFLYQRRWID
jgi:hypothetical protein